MAVSISNALGAFTKGRTALANSAGEKSVLDFYKKLSEYGTTLRARYEVSFSGIENVTFFVTDITTPDARINMGTVYFEGKSVEIPINFEYTHDFSMTILNDGKGILYTTVLNWLMDRNDGESIVNSGYTMTIRGLGDGENQDGITITLNGVRFKNISGLTYSSNDAGVSTFNLACSAISFTATIGQLQKVAGIAGALQSLLK